MFLTQAQAAPAELTAVQYSTVYNVLSLAIASLLFTAVYLLLVRGRVAPRYRNAVVVSAIVCLIAAYHYVRIFNNFGESYPAGDTALSNHVASNIEFNEGYRYVDWLLTVPLLLLETVAVLTLARREQGRLLMKLIPASALMIILGYPGEITLELAPRAIWGALSTIPFIYILYVLFVELSRSIATQPVQVQHTIKMLRIALVGLWGVYPIAYLFPMFGVLGLDFFAGSDAYVLKQIGYSLADIFAKAAFGLGIYKVARVKSGLEDPTYDDDVDHDRNAAGPTDRVTPSDTSPARERVGS